MSMVTTPFGEQAPPSAPPPIVLADPMLGLISEIWSRLIERLL